jgi:hypothetical protein
MRVTNLQLEAVVERINRVTGADQSSYTRGADGKLRANIGNYHLSFAYGGVSLHRMMSDGGGVEDVFRCGHIPKRELLNRMHAFIDGLERRV